MRPEQPRVQMRFGVTRSSFLLTVAGLLLSLGQPLCVWGLNGGDPWAAGNWIVNGSETFSGITRVWNGNITVSRTGELNISNSALVFNSSASVRYGIIVERGGRLAISHSRLASANSSEGFVFLAEGSLDLRNSRVDNVYSGTLGLAWIGGFVVRSDNPSIQNTVFSGSLGYCIRFEGCRNVFFSNNTVTNTSTALLLNRSTGVVKDSSFLNNSDRDIVILGCDGLQLLNNILNSTGAAALVVSGSRNVRTSGNTYRGGLYTVYARDTTMQMEADSIADGMVDVEAEDGSRLSLIDCLCDPQKVYAKSGSEVSLKRIVTIHVAVGGKSVSGAAVTVSDSKKNKVGDGTTAEDGTAVLLVTEWMVTEKGGSVPRPFRFKAVKGLRSASKTVATLGYDWVELKMALPWGFIIASALFLVLLGIVVASPPKTKRKPKRTRR